MDPYVGEVRLYSGTQYVPSGWLLCDGSQLAIRSYQLLYAVIGNIYGGTTPDTFNLPKIIGQVPVGAGSGTGLTPRNLGSVVGASTVYVQPEQMPSHTHTVQCVQPLQAGQGPTGAVWANGTRGAAMHYAPLNITVPPSSVQMSSLAIGMAGPTQALPHNNMQPYVSLVFMIAYEGIYPSPAD
jgi:microcystin-dependent protein